MVEISDGQIAKVARELNIYSSASTRRNDAQR
jgi:hypothetical protein